MYFFNWIELLIESGNLIYDLTDPLPNITLTISQIYCKAWNRIRETILNLLSLDFIEYRNFIEY